MKTNRVVLKAIAAALLTASGAASADTQPLAVSATVSGVCKFTTASRTLGFTVDPSSTSDIAGVMSGDIQYKCTNGTSATGVTASNGSNFSTVRRMRRGATTDYLPYSLTIAGGTQAGTGFGSGQEKTLTVTGSVAVADFENLTAGTYADAVTLTLTP